jgi:hypothetical protein
MTAEEIVEKLFSAGAKIDVLGDQLKVHVDKGTMTSEMASFIKGEKQQIIDCVNRRKGGIVPAPHKDYYVPSSAQRRQYFLHEFHKHSLAYNLPQVIRIEGDLDKARLSDAFQRLLQRHEILRTSFVLIDGEPFQKIIPHVDFVMEYLPAAENATDAVIAGFIRPFDLSVAPLIRAGLVEINVQKYLLIVDMHHIITDGISHILLTKDILALYTRSE